MINSIGWLGFVYIEVSERALHGNNVRKACKNGGDWLQLLVMK